MDLHSGSVRMNVTSWHAISWAFRDKTWAMCISCVSNGFALDGGLTVFGRFAARYRRQAGR